jgi:hypothetical protein
VVSGCDGGDQCGIRVRHGCVDRSHRELSKTPLLVKIGWVDDEILNKYPDAGRYFVSLEFFLNESCYSSLLLLLSSVLSLSLWLLRLLLLLSWWPFMHLSFNDAADKRRARLMDLYLFFKFRIPK